MGFPGETEEDFGALVDFCREVEFDHLGVFTYSNEEGTEAFDPADALSVSEKAGRWDHLMSQQATLSLRKNREKVGSKLRILVEGLSEETDLLLRGRTEGQAPEIDGSVLINDGWAEPGRFVTVEVAEAHPYDLVAHILSEG